MRKFDEKMARNIVSVLLNWNEKTGEMEGKLPEAMCFFPTAAGKVGGCVEHSALYVLHNKSVIHIMGDALAAPGDAAQETGDTPGA